MQELDRKLSENKTMKELALERGLENQELQSTNEKLAAHIKSLERFIIDSHDCNE